MKRFANTSTKNEKNMKVIWRKKANKSLIGIFNFIAKDSEKRAFDVIQKITEHANNLVIFPEKFEHEHAAKTTRNIRRVVIFSYKIIYEVTPETVFILDIFHSAQSSDKLKTL
jgi:plasmid stabilization system protein ParE